MIGVTLLSFFVWQHHLFVSGINPDMRPLFMLTTELISIPTGFIFLVAHGHALEGEDPLHRADAVLRSAFYFNFLIGGISGVFLSDVPADTTEHGSFFVMAHFHYTIMGGLIFAFMAGCYYWLPKMMGIKLNQTLGKSHFWLMFIAFNSTFLPLFAVGMAGPAAPGVRVRAEPADAERLGVDLVVLPRRLDPDLRDQLRLVDGDRPGARGWATRGARAAWSGRSPRRRRPATSRRSPWCCPGRMSTACLDAPPVADLNPPVGRAQRRLRGHRDRSERRHRRWRDDSRGPPRGLTREQEEAAFYHEAALNASWTGVRLADRRPVVPGSAPSCSRSSTCGR